MIYVQIQNQSLTEINGLCLQSLLKAKSSFKPGGAVIFIFEFYCCEMIVVDRLILPD